MILFGNIEGHSIQYYKKYNKVKAYHILAKNDSIMLESNDALDFVDQMDELQETVDIWFNKGADYLHFLLETIMLKYGSKKVSVSMTSNQSIYEIKVKHRRRILGKHTKYTHRYRSSENI